jgi:hypothetical protein
VSLPASPVSATVAAAQPAAEWDFQVTPCAWMSGDAGAIPSAAACVDPSFGDILQDPDAAGMPTASAHRMPLPTL